MIFYLLYCTCTVPIIQYCYLSYSVEGGALAGKQVVLFSYGSGLASAMYSIRVTTDLERLAKVMKSVSDIPKRLAGRQFVPPPEFEQTMKLREETHHRAPYSPVGNPADLFPGTYYLVSVDDKHRRVYNRFPLQEGALDEAPPSLKSPLAQSVTLTNGKS